MAAGEPSPATFGLLVLNLALYSALAIIAGWAINYGIEETEKTGKNRSRQRWGGGMLISSSTLGLNCRFRRRELCL